MIDYTDRLEFLRARKAEADRQYREGEITRAVYTASLFGLGYRGQEIQSEANLVEMDHRLVNTPLTQRN